MQQYLVLGMLVALFVMGLFLYSKFLYLETEMGSLKQNFYALCDQCAEPDDTEKGEIVVELEDEPLGESDDEEDDDEDDDEEDDDEEDDDEDEPLGESEDESGDEPGDEPLGEPKEEFDTLVITADEQPKQCGAVIKSGKNSGQPCKRVDCKIHV